LYPLYSLYYFALFYKLADNYYDYLVHYIFSLVASTNYIMNNRLN